MHSIYNKMQKKHVSFEEVYDVFAIRIIIDTRPELEKADCWKVYSIVTDFYQPNPDRLRDWISLPKANGYESLHTTVMSPGGRWVEVQIRSKRMDEVAEMGLAAHYRYKDDEEHCRRLGQLAEPGPRGARGPRQQCAGLRERLQAEPLQRRDRGVHPEGRDAQPARPAPPRWTSPSTSTRQIGRQCIGAKVNHKLVPLSQPLRSGDQIEVITSKKQQPKEDWLTYVVTAKARHKIKQALRDQKTQARRGGPRGRATPTAHLGRQGGQREHRRLVDHFRCTFAHGPVLPGSPAASTCIEDLKDTAGEERPLGPAQGEARRRGRAHLGGSGGRDPRARRTRTLLIGDDLQKIEYKLSHLLQPHRRR